MVGMYGIGMAGNAGMNSGKGAVWKEKKSKVPGKRTECVVSL